MPDNVFYDFSLLQEMDIYLFKQGNHLELYHKLGSHLVSREGSPGVHFAVWAPNAEYVSVKGDFNSWDQDSHPLRLRQDESGIWEGFIPGLQQGALYKYHIRSRFNNYQADKTDPFAFYMEYARSLASVVWDLEYAWQDQDWMQSREKVNSLSSPISAYELHLGSWRRKPEEGDRFLSYRELAPALASYIQDTGFTHVELMPVMEHPFYGSWGYQCLGFFAPTARYGTPQDFMYLVDFLHQQGIGVILDWVPSHFPSDETGLVYFDGTHLFEHMDPQKGFHPEWKSYIFNYGRHEVRSFLLSSAMFWLDKYHADCLRVDAVASMLYLDYGREDGEWIPNEYGGRENLQAIDFLQTLNMSVYKHFPSTQTIAEESTSWPQVTRPTYTGGLGFGIKWNMGWMHDTLEYFSQDPVYRKYHQNKLTFSVWYAFTENFLLPLSHDEVVYGKGSLLDKMPGDLWQKLANLRLLLGYMYTYPGKKLLFMGGEFGQWQEWYHEESLHWHLLQQPEHQGLQRWLRELNLLYRQEPALHQLDFQQQGFEWVDFSDQENSVISYLRQDAGQDELFLMVCNFTPVPRHNYQVGVPAGGFWREILNSDAQEYWGSGQGNFGGLRASPEHCHDRYHSLSLTLPPLGIAIFKRTENPWS
ncbi:MAG: 1,4-alpha-glucan branching protein GlgB [Desulfohalobiaceae bacterium]